MTKWLLGVLGAGVALVLVTLALLLVAINMSWTASWFVERVVRATIDPRLEIRGAVDLDVFPVFAVRAHDLLLPARLDGIPEQCLAKMGLGDPAHWRMARIEAVLDWQTLLTGQLEAPAIHVDGLVVTQGLPAVESDSQAQVSSDNWFSRHIGGGSGSWNRLRIGDLLLSGARLEACDQSEGFLTIAHLRRASLSADLRSATDDQQASAVIAGLSGQIAFVLDDLLINPQQLGSDWARWFRDTNYLDAEGLIKVDTTRARWSVDAGVAKLESFLLLGAGANVELVSGEIDFARKTVDFRFEVETQRAGSALVVPGVNIILRQTKLPVSIQGPWSRPSLIVGQE